MADEKVSQVVVFYGQGDPKKHSVRFEATGVKDDAIPTNQIGDAYIMRSILNALGIKDTGRVRVTFENAD